MTFVALFLRFFLLDLYLIWQSDLFDCYSIEPKWVASQVMKKLKKNREHGEINVAMERTSSTEQNCNPLFLPSPGKKGEYQVKEKTIETASSRVCDVTNVLYWSKTKIVLQ